MESTGQLWTIVLAAGEGSRLRDLTMGPQGKPVPKQFWKIDDRSTMLHWTLERAARITSRERIVPIVSAKHRQHWAHELGAVASRNVIVQPENRGTAAGLLLPLLHVVMNRDPHATIVVLPSDHYVADEDALRRSLRCTQLAVEANPEKIVLLGITPDQADPELGWIRPLRGDGLTHEVQAFVEKPNGEVARELFAKGALWNSFMFVANAMTLVQLFAEKQRALLTSFINAIEARGWSASNLEKLYAEVPTVDFSRDLLQVSTESLRVLPVPSCGWTDLGTPARVAAWRESLRVRKVAALPPVRVPQPRDRFAPALMVGAV